MLSYDDALDAGQKWLEETQEAIINHYFPDCDYPVGYADSCFDDHNDQLSMWFTVTLPEEKKAEIVALKGDEWLQYQSFFTNMAIAAGYDYPLPEIWIADDKTTISFAIEKYCEKQRASYGGRY